MKSYPILLMLMMLAACGSSPASDDKETEQLYVTLDTEIANSKVYEIEKNERIKKLKHECDLSTDKRQTTEIINQIISEFEAYNADSALYYISLNLQRPAAKAVPGQHTRLMIQRADVYAHAGLFSDALATIGSIPRDSLTRNVLEDYYAAYCCIYQYLSEYTSEHETQQAYEDLRSVYVDSLKSVVTPASFNYLVFQSPEMARNGEPGEALTQLRKSLESHQSGTREYSILASTLAYIYKTLGMNDDYRHYLLRSAISDVRGAVKENMSFREVATERFDHGDVERAHRYLQKSMADANFYSALMRNTQSGKMLPVISEAYSTLQTELSSRLRVMAVVSGVLSVLLLVTMVLIIKQFRNLRKAKDKVSSSNEELSRVSELLRESIRALEDKNEALSKMSSELTEANRNLGEKNEELSSLSEQLMKANTELATRNTDLRELGRTKEQYAALFMAYSSSAISELQRYQNSLRNLTKRGASRDDLVKKLESTGMAERLLKNFYMKFDEAILNIYPSFVEKFNALLRPDEQIVLKAGELLNTELRLFALIRMGIDDNSTMAEFLRCTISTVYTYRSKMKRRALNPEKFEEEVRNIV